ncbi:PQQ-dependent sugar dehydrogenase [Arthrobacter sp. JZ12]|nr:PQQ-dependent sugar dehydrogenase [Arthrobacter sp. JZ12]
MRFPRHLRGVLPVLAIALSVVAAGSGCSPAPEPAPRVAGTTQPASSAPGTSGPAAESRAPGTAEAATPLAPPNLVPKGEIAAGLGTPWSMAFLPNGDLLVTERETGEVKRISGGQVEVIGVLPEAVGAGGEGGLLGIAVGPDFESDPRLYLYFTGPEDNRVVYVPYGEEGLGEPVPILTGLPKANIHNGGRIKFGPDGHLYVGTGDAAGAEQAQDPDNPAGKILRVTGDGDPAPGNPFGTKVYSLGHRNVQGLAWDSDGRLWASEFGPDRDDELNLITPGGNYGWPEVTGAPGHEDYVDAKVVWPSTATSSPSGMAIIDDTAYIGGLRGERLWQVPLNAESASEPVSHFQGEYGRLRDTIAGPDGELLVATNETGGSRILRFSLD